MPVLKIQDYLQTQGLRLSKDMVHMSYLAVQAVMDVGHASIDRSVLWYADDEVVLSDYFEQNDDNEALLKQIFMALDSVFSRTERVSNATVYALRLSENNHLCLLRLAQQGERVEQKMTVDEEYGRFYLPVRTAQTGWLNLVDDVDSWLKQGELQGEHHSRSRSQISLPVCTDSGVVLGVVHVEYQDKEALNEEAQAEWVALSLALSQPLSELLKVELTENNDDQTD